MDKLDLIISFLKWDTNDQSLLHLLEMFLNFILCWMFYLNLSWMCLMPVLSFLSLYDFNEYFYKFGQYALSSLFALYLSDYWILLSFYLIHLFLHLNVYAVIEVHYSLVPSGYLLYSLYAFEYRVTNWLSSVPLWSTLMPITTIISKVITTIYDFSMTMYTASFVAMSLS